MFHDVGGKAIREVAPGEMLVIDKNGNLKFEQVVAPDPHFCFFQWPYFLHENSTFAGVRVADLRRSLGYQLFEEFSPNDIDVVTYSPRAPKFTTHGYAEKFARTRETEYEKICCPTNNRTRIQNNKPERI